MKKRKVFSTTLLVLIIVSFCLIGTIVKLLYVALSPTVSGINLKEFAENRNTKTKTLYASRGTIYDAAGEELALSVNSYTLIAYLSSSRTLDENNPQHVVDKAYTASRLAEVLGADEKTILEYLNKDAYQVEFGTYGHNLKESIKKKIEDLELPGIDFIEGTQRYYKMGDFASYIIGYAKTTEDGDIVGELGIEGYYNDELSGTDGYKTYEADAYGYQLPSKPSVTVSSKSGDDIYLTLDSNIQIKAENALDKLDEEYDFDWAIITIMNAKTGAIVASATSPSYNPNDLNTLTSYLNPLVSYTLEPGSTMKTFAWASAIEEGIYDGSKLYQSGSIKVNDALISDFNKVGWGMISYDTGYVYSSNTAATNLALQLGVKKLSSYYQKFGFGKKTGIELAGEVAGDISFTYKSELATASFGQGITVTPIQMLQAYSAIANDGIMLKPYIVSKIVDDDGNVTYEGGKTEVGRVMKSETAAYMRKLMYDVNYNGLTKSWQPKTVKLIMKTGTAEIASETGGYMDGKYDNIYSIAGIFPDEDPEYIIYAAVKRIVGPQKAVATMAANIVDDIASYAKITEIEKTDTESNIITLDNYTSKKVQDIKEKLTNLNVIVIGDGEYIKSQYPLNGSKLVKGNKIYLITNSDNYTMINLTSWSLSDVKTYANLTGLNLTYSGSGYVTEQSIKENENFKSGDNLNVVLKE